VLPKTGLGADWIPDGKYLHDVVLGGVLSGIGNPQLLAFRMKSSLAEPFVPLGVVPVGPRYSGGRLAWPLPSALEALGPGLSLGKVRFGLWTRVGSSPWKSAMGLPGGLSLVAKTDAIEGWFPKTETAREKVQTLRSWTYGLRYRTVRSGTVLYHTIGTSKSLYIQGTIPYRTVPYGTWYNGTVRYRVQYTVGEWLVFTLINIKTIRPLFLIKEPYGK
jgi:hypothetical protein